MLFLAHYTIPLYMVKNLAPLMHNKSSVILLKCHVSNFYKKNLTYYEVYLVDPKILLVCRGGTDLVNIRSVCSRHLLHIMSEKALLRSENTLSLVGENKKQQQQQQKKTTQYDSMYIY